MEFFAVFLRVGVLGFSTILGTFAFFMFCYRLHIVSKEKKITPQKNSGTSLTSSRITTFNGKNSLIINSSNLSNDGSAYTSNLSKTSVSRSPTKNNSNFEKKLEALVVQSENKKFCGRFPPWDEVEMRRHGLVNRCCDRVYGPDCPSNPSTIEVSRALPFLCSAVSSYNKINGINGPPVSQDSIRCSLPPDSSSIYSNFSSYLVTPSTTTTTPSSHQTGEPSPNASSLMPSIFEPTTTTHLPMMSTSKLQNIPPTTVPSSNTQQQIQNQNLQSPEPSTTPTPAMPKTSPTQVPSQPSLTSVYVEPNLYNSSYAYQKTGI